MTFLFSSVNLTQLEIAARGVNRCAKNGCLIHYHLQSIGIFHNGIVSIVVQRNAARGDILAGVLVHHVEN